MNKAAGKRKPQQPVQGAQGCGNKWTPTDHRRLEELLNDGSLKVNDTGAKVKELDVHFVKFSNQMIGHHLGLLKKKKRKRLTVSVYFSCSEIVFISSCT